jgi:hypothetical protein
MGQAERGHIQHEIENEANKLFPGRIRRVELLHHGDAPMIDPGQQMPSFVFVDPTAAKGVPAARRMNNAGLPSQTAASMGPMFAEHITYNECLPTLVGKFSSGLGQS